ncbi:unnamed protein product, partial [Amoebophrya sp. A25]
TELSPRILLASDHYLEDLFAGLRDASSETNSTEVIIKKNGTNNSRASSTTRASRSRSMSARNSNNNSNSTIPGRGVSFVAVRHAGVHKQTLAKRIEKTSPKNILKEID